MRKLKVGFALCIVVFAIRATAQNTFPATGNVGIGTTTPGQTLTVVGDQFVGAGVSTYDWGNDNATLQVVSMPNAPSVITAFQPGYAIVSFGSKATDTNAYFTNDYNDGGFGQAGNSITLTKSGNVGIGTTSPGATLEVDGSIKLTASSGGSITFQDGTVQSTAYTGVTCGGDYAELVDVMGGRTSYEPGDLLVIDPTSPGKFLKSAEAYSTLVAGIYSTKPGTVGRRQTSAKSPDEVPMAMMGIVPTKVSAENGPIKTGDLLVASSTMGYAMKGTDRTRLTGAVVGKALGPLDSGNGVIEVLVTLQ
jgi:hypothetical protein